MTALAVKPDSTTPDAGMWSFGTIWTTDDAGTENTTAFTQGAFTDTWLLVQSTAANAMPTDRVTIRIFTLAGLSDCYLIDDRQLRRE